MMNCTETVGKTVFGRNRLLLFTLMILMAIGMALFASSVSDDADAIDGNFTIDGAEYRIASEPNKTVELSSYSGSESSFAIPSMVTYCDVEYSVVGIGSYAFNNCVGLIEVTIPASVTCIYYSAFENCVDLESIIIPDSVTRIDQGAFYGCKSLVSVSLPSGLTELRGDLFNGCTLLSSITIPDGVKYIESYVFGSCESLSSITIPDSVTYIGYGAFYSCKSLSSIVVPSKVTTLESSAFKSCTSLSSVTLNAELTYFSDDLFNGCSSLGSIEIPDTVKTLNYRVFEGCISLESIILPGTISSYRSYIFRDCTSLASVQFESMNQSMFLLNNDMFSGCNNLKTVTISSGTVASGVFEELASIQVVILEEGVEGIYSCAFNGCIGITSIEIPKTVSSIYMNAFDGCAGLESITVNPDNVSYSSENGVLFNKSKTEILHYPHNKNGSYTVPSSVESISDNQFFGRSCLTSISISDGTISIGSDAFSNCSKLTTLTISKTVESIGERIVNLCPNLESIVVDAENGFYSSVDGVLFDKNASILMQYPIKKTGSYVVPESVLKIDNYAFASCSGLTSVIFSSRLVTIGVGSFVGCTGLERVDVVDSVELIGQDAFNGCSGLKTLRIGSGISSIGVSAFRSCASLSDVTILSGLTSLGSHAFSDCDSLTSITLPDSVNSVGSYLFAGSESLESVVISKNITSYPDGMFINCTNLKSITIPSHIATLGDSVFEGCIGLISIVIPDSVTSLGDSAFEGCINLKSVTIGFGLKSMGNCTFRDCTALSSLIIPNNVTTLGDSSFTGCSNLESVRISEKITYLPFGTFEDCEKLVEVILSNDILGIGANSFKGCSVLTSLGNLNSLNTVGDSAFKGCVSLEKLPDGCSLSYVGSSAFEGCSNLEIVDVSDDAEYIGSSAFRDCVSLVRINLGLIDTIYESTFSGCTSLKSVSGDSYTSIGSYAFQNCVSLTSAIINSNVDYIGTRAYYGCTSLRVVAAYDFYNYDPDVEIVRYVGEEVFIGCISLSEVSSWGSETGLTPALFSVKFYCDGEEVLNIESQQWLGSGLDGKLYNARNGHLVHFYSEGLVSSDLMVTDGGILHSLPVTSREGYIFDCWTLNGEQITGDTVFTEESYVSARWTPLKYTITYVYGNGEDDESVDVDCGSAVPLPTLSRDGYEFLGWYRDESKEPCGNFEMPPANIILEAKWKLKTYIIKFHANGGEGFMEDQIVPCLESVPLNKSTFTKYESYLYSWCVSPEGMAQEYMDGEVIYNLSNTDGDVINLYAMWNINRYWVEFDTDGGTPMDPIQIGYNNSLWTPESTTKVGYAFNGWFVKGNGNEPAPENMPGHDLVLKAKWSPITYYVAFDNTLGDGSMDSMELTYDVPTKLISNTFTRVEASFREWCTDYYGNGTTFEDAEEVLNLSAVSGETVTLYAQWNVNRYNIIFDTDGGSKLDPISVEYGAYIPHNIPTPTKVGSQFYVWNYDYYTLMPAHDIVYTAVWQKIQYHIYFDCGGGHSWGEYYYYGDKVEVKQSPMWEGHVFTGWDIEVPKTMPAESLTLTAQWEVLSYNVTFFVEDYGVVETRVMEWGTVIVGPDAPELPEMVGRIPLYWSAEWHTVPARDTSVIGVYDYIEYTFTFDSNGGSAVEPLVMHYGEDIWDARHSDREGYTFEGWYLEGSDVPYQFTTMPAENLHFKAKWSVNTYYISFSTSYGNYMPNLELEYGAPIPEIEDPVAMGYDFLGWDKELPDTMPAEDIYLMAEWKIKTLTVYFYADDVLFYSITAEYGTQLEDPPEVPTKEGYRFSEWSDWYSGMMFMPAEDTIVKAVWVANAYSITFDSNGGWPVNPIALGYETEITDVPVPTYRGYVFQGWYLEDSDEPYVFTTMPLGGAHLIAKWAPEEYLIKFDPNGGVGEMDDQVTYIDQDAVLIGCTFQRLGYTFDGWNTHPEGTGSTYKPGDSFPFYYFSTNKSVNLYALWVLSESSFWVDGIEYTVTAHTDSVKEVGVSGCNNESSSIIIPSTIRNSIGVEYDVTSIMSYAFDYCDNVVSIEMPESVESIEGYAFYESGIESITLPSKITELSDNIFSYCSDLVTVSFKGALTSIGESSFSYCESLVMDIPDTVVEIGRYAFSECSSLESITIPDGVQHILDGTFYNCTSLKSVTFCDGLQSIGYTSFRQCYNLGTFTLPEGLKTIGNSAFNDCNSITSLVIPDSVTEIESEAFALCLSLESLHIGSGVRTLYGVFHECYDLKEVTFAEGVTTLQNGTFKDCDDLVEVKLPNTLECIGNNVFQGCSRLRGISIPSSVTTVGHSAFMWCSSLTSITIPEGVTMLQDSFYECKSLAYVDIPDSVIEINGTAFEGISFIVDEEPIEVNASNLSGKTWVGSGLSSELRNLDSGYEVIFDPVGGTSTSMIMVTVDGKLPVLPTVVRSESDFLGWFTEDGIKVTGSYVFDRDTTVFADWDASDYTIHFNTFHGSYVPSITQDYATKVMAPEPPTSSGYRFIGWYMQGEDEEYVFTVMPSKDIYLEARWEECSYTIEFDANGGTGSMADIRLLYTDSVNLPKNTFVMDGFVFDRWTLGSDGSEIWYLDGSMVSMLNGEEDGSVTLYAQWSLSQNNFWSNGIGYTVTAHTDSVKEVMVTSIDTTNANITIPEIVSNAFGFEYSVVSVKDYAFNGCRAVTSISLPDSIREIGSYAFHNCINLMSVNIPQGIVELKPFVFYGCTSLESLTLPDGLESIGESVFSNCESLTTIMLPDSLETIGVSAFQFCVGLESMDIPEGIVAIPDYAFEWCTNMGVVSLPSGLESIGIHAFSECSSLDVDLPTTLVDIGSYAFSSCSSLAVANIPNVIGLGDHAFDGCFSLESITLSDSLESIGAYAFSTTSIQEIDLPNSLIEVGEGAFSLCSSLASIEIPDGVRELKDTFKGSVNLSRIVIPSSVETISSDTFRGIEFFTGSDASVSVSELAGKTWVGSGVDSRLFDSRVGHTITFDAMGGMTTSTLMVTLNGLLPSVPVAERIGYVFGGWTLEDGAPVSETTSFTSDTTLFASWIQKMGTLHIDIGFWPPMDPVILGYGAPIELPDIDMAGYIFEGWYDVDGHPFRLKTMPIDENVYVYAHWRPVEYTVVFDGNGAEGSMGPIDAVYNTPISPPEFGFTWEDHIMHSWNTKPDGTGKEIYLTQPIYMLSEVDGDIVTLYAQWKLIEYTIHLVNEFGYSPTIVQGYGTVIEVPSDPTSWGRSFKGWYLEDSDEPYVFTTMPRGDLTLYAKWDPAKYIIRFDGNGAIGEMADIDATYGESYTLPAVAFVNDGFKFDRWEGKNNGMPLFFNDGATVSDVSGIDGDIVVLRAIWTLEVNTIVIGGVEYLITEHGESRMECVVSGFEGNPVDIVIPSKVTSEIGYEYDVVGMDQRVFYGCASLRSVVLPETFTSIAYGAFYNCTSLTEVTIPDSVRTIGGNAFHGCKSLEYITLPEGLEKIENYCFYDCSNLKSVKLPDSLITLEYGSFHGCTDILQIEIGKNLSSLDSDCFDGCMDLKKFIISGENKYYKSVDDVLFSKDGSTLYRYPSGRAGDSYTVPAGTKYLLEESFSFANSLKEVNLPDGLQVIDQYTFYGCVNLEKVNIPSSVETIGPVAFGMCMSITSFDVDSKNNKYESIDGVIFEMSIRGVPIRLIEYPAGKTDTTYTVPDSVYEIYQEAFGSNSNLVSVVLPDGLITLGDSAFSLCTSLKSVNLPEGLEEIGYSPFNMCSSLETIHIPSTLIDIEGWGFYGCTSLKNITVAPNHPSLKSIDGVLFSKDGTKLISYPSGRTAESYDVPDGVTSIYNVFDSIHLKKVTLPNIGVHFEDFNNIGHITVLYRDAQLTEEYEYGEIAGDVYIKNVPESYTLYFDPNGGVMPNGFTGSVEYVYGTDMSLPVPTNEGCVFLGWYFYGMDSELIRHIDAIMDGMEFRAMWAPKPVNITFDANDGDLDNSGDKVVYKTDTYGVLPTPTREGYSFDGWFTSKVGGERVTSGTVVSTHNDHKLYAHWSILRFTIVFEFEGEPLEGYPITVDYGTVLGLPSVSPYKAPTVNFEFLFDKWLGYSSNMVIKSDMVFSASFTATAIACPEVSDEGTIDFIVDDSEEVVFTPEIIEEIKEAIQESESVKVEVSHGSIEMDKDSVSKLDGEKKVSMTKVEKEEVPEQLPVEVKERPVFEVSVGDVHDFEGGTLTITFKYQLLDGENAEYLQVWHFNDDGTYEVEECIYDSVKGCIVFSTGTLSYFSVMHVEPEPEPTPTPGPGNTNPDDSSEGGGNMVIFIGAGAAAVAVIGLVVFFLIRRKA